MEGEKFLFEKLEVWHQAIDFADLCIDLIDNLKTDRKHYRLIEQFESAATSPALNIAEGKGRFSKKEYVQFLYIARGSLFETVSLLEIFRRRQWIQENDLLKLKNQAAVLGRRLNSLITSLKKNDF